MVEIRSGGQLLPAKAFDRVPGALNGAVIENKFLSGAVRYIQEQQKVRDAELLAGGKLTKRDKRHRAQKRGEASLEFAAE